MRMAGAEKHRNPDEDLPGDFEERRAEYYRELGRDADARAFTTALKSKLTDAHLWWREHPRRARLVE